MADVWTIGEILVELMRPELGTPLRDLGTFRGPYPSGAPAIFIDAVAKLGLTTGIVGCVGEDAFGQAILSRLKADGVDTSQVAVRADFVTGMAFVTYFPDGRREFLFHMPQSAAAQVRFTPGASSKLREAKLLHVSGSSLGQGEAVRMAVYDAVRTAKQAGAVILFDPNIRVELASEEEVRNWSLPVLEHCDYVLPSEGELELVTGKPDMESAEAWCFSLGVQGVVRKKGPAGSSLLLNSGEGFSSPAYHVEPVDPTGAGDCFCAGFAYSLIRELSWQDALDLSNAMGALAVQMQGPMEGCVTLEEVHRFQVRMQR